ncbi:hypothetical protein AVEN_112201-1 [Araneus ventricosus]|uniref:Uncharacterized protein n=1 Tax=Araneus ventricosus TaxID=182803 RepID=A0A4Y2W6W2_ARAVE|nr:hypothetical protein AVEN_112201-1 [Araneus ventricosus]
MFSSLILLNTDIGLPPQWNLGTQYGRDQSSRPTIRAPYTSFTETDQGDYCRSASSDDPVRQGPVSQRTGESLHKATEVTTRGRSLGRFFLLLLACQRFREVRGSYLPFGPLSTRGYIDR